MDRMIIQLNIDRFRRLLETKLDPGTRETVERLLAEAQADLDGTQDQPTTDDD